MGYNVYSATWVNKKKPSVIFSSGLGIDCFKNNILNISENFGTNTFYHAVITAIIKASDPLT